MDAVLVRNAERMMLSAALTEDGIGLTFADGCRGVVPFIDLPEIGERSDVHALALPNPYEMILTTALGERVELPWDFVRHYCDRSYRPMVEAIALQGRRTLGERVRRFRESAGLTQKVLARSAGIGRVTPGQAGEWGADAPLQDAGGHRGVLGEAGPGSGLRRRVGSVIHIRGCMIR